MTRAERRRRQRALGDFGRGERRQNRRAVQQARDIVPGRVPDPQFDLIALEAAVTTQRVRQQILEPR